METGEKSPVGWAKASSPYKRLPVQADRVNAGIYQDIALLFGRRGPVICERLPTQPEKRREQMQIFIYGDDARLFECRRLLEVADKCGAVSECVRDIHLLPIPSRKVCADDLKSHFCQRKTALRDGSIGYENSRGNCRGTSRKSEIAMNGASVCASHALSEKMDLLVGYEVPQFLREIPGLRVFDLAQDEVFLQRNARLCALGTLGVILTEHTRVPSDLHIGVIGYGRIGKEVCDLLRFLEAPLVVFTSKEDTVRALSTMKIPSVLVDWTTENATNVNEESVYQVIDDCVRRAKKYPFRHVDEVCITRSELEFIGKLNNIKQEKIAFVLLASAKYYDLTRGTQYYTAYMKNSDICKLARVTIPVSDRDVFMQFAYDKGVLSRHSRAASIEKKVLFISNDDIVLRLKENDFKDLAYTYLAYKTPRQFRRCVVCRGWMKKDSKDRRVCKECSDKEDVEKNTIKEVQCVDCGRIVYISVINNKTYRCEDCQKNADDRSNRERQQRWYATHKT
jgi:hypothetical protein